MVKLSRYLRKEEQIKQYFFATVTQLPEIPHKNIVEPQTCVWIYKTPFIMRCENAIFGQNHYSIFNALIHLQLHFYTRQSI